MTSRAEAPARARGGGVRARGRSIGHNGPVTPAAGVALALAVTAQQSQDEGFGLQAGPFAFIVFVGLGLSLVFLLRSMRKQMRRVDFDETGASDAERMRGASSPPPGPPSDGG